VAEDTNPSPVAGKMEGPTPPIVARSKPANSATPRASEQGSLLDGPFGGKRPQS